MSEIVIEKGIAIFPDRRGRKPKYPFVQMEVGDSFVIAPNSAGAVNYARKIFKKWRFTMRRLPDGKWRVWRTA